MSHSCFDSDHDQTSNRTLDLLADPFRRRVLSAAVLAAIGFALLVAGIPFPAQATETVDAGAIDFTRDINAPAGYPQGTDRLCFDPSGHPRLPAAVSTNILNQGPHANERSDPRVITRPYGKSLAT